MTGLTTVGLEQVQREIYSRLLARFVRLRLTLGPFLFLAIFGLLADDPARWRVIVLSVVTVAVIARLAFEYFHFRASGFQESRVTLLTNWVAPLILALFVSTGGLGSPLMPMLLPVSFFLSLFISPRAAVIQSVAQSAVLWTLVWLALAGPIPDLLPQAFGGGHRVPSTNSLLYWQASVYQFALLWSTGIGQLLRQAYRDMIERALKARDEVLTLHTDTTRTLTALSGEIAHELKNPLASVKGLAALIDRDLTGKAQERITILRQEVERMQEILDSFLNFSRPLIPLDSKRVRLRSLCEEVAALHEGQALERGVQLRVLEESPVQLHADPRKVKQVLINLVQNALEVSPRGSSVELVVSSADGGGGRIEVRDQGPGISPEQQSRLFEPGVTTKAHGSGLGLTIARALARQHGGELTLEPRTGGGSIASVTLPESPR